MVLIKSLSNGIAVAFKDQLVISTSQGCETVNVPEPILPENLTIGQISVLKKETRTITSVAFSKTEEYVAISTENKQVVVYDKEFKVVRNFIVNRAASKVLLTSKNDIIVADKTGDVYLYYFKDDKEPTLLLGHLSVILDIQLTDCEKYIITSDRDEKIRVSRFPNAYNIVSFCLGHKEFVTTLRLCKNTLLSASGDGTVRLWNFKTGDMLGLVDCNENIKDKSLLDSFAKEMEEEKVDVLALPVNDMQVLDALQTLIVVSIFKLKGLQMYSIDFNTNKIVYVGNILQTQSIISFCVSTGLVVLCEHLLYFDMINGQPVEATNNYIDKLNKQLAIKNVDNNSFITALYKRKFDNVQEYLERKKQRLSGK